MSSEAKGVDQPDGPQPGETNPSLCGSPDTPSHAEALQAIGYEAADPALQAPLWTEAMGDGPTPRHLR